MIVKDTHYCRCVVKNTVMLCKFPNIYIKTFLEKIFKKYGTTHENLPCKDCIKVIVLLNPLTEKCEIVCPKVQLCFDLNFESGQNSHKFKLKT